MAKRKRLTPAQMLSTGGAAGPAPVLGTPPIASVAGDAAAMSALQEVTKTLEQARTGGRMVVDLPFGAVVEDYLVRDRVKIDPEDLESLKASLKARGQQTPIEVVDMEEGRFGLISGWRRLTALKQLADEAGTDAAQTVQALLRRPEDAPAAYVAMVEENEIRVGLGYFERARITLKAVELGVFATDKAALGTLFASASRAKRSKIKSFMPVVAALEDALRFPSALNERIGLQLSKALEQDSGFATRLKDRLRKADAASAEAEQALLARALSGAEADIAPVPAKTRKPEPVNPRPAQQLAEGIYAQRNGAGALVLSGPKVDADFEQRLQQWLSKSGR